MGRHYTPWPTDPCSSCPRPGYARPDGIRCSSCRVALAHRDVRPHAPPSVPSRWLCCHCQICGSATATLTQMSFSHVCVACSDDMTATRPVYPLPRTCMDCQSAGSGYAIDGRPICKAHLHLNPDAGDFRRARAVLLLQDATERSCGDGLFGSHTGQAATMMEHVDRIAALLPAYDKQGAHLTATPLSTLAPALAAYAADLTARYPDIASPATVHLLPCAAAPTRPVNLELPVLRVALDPDDASGFYAWGAAAAPYLLDIRTAGCKPSCHSITPAQRPARPLPPDVVPPIVVGEATHAPRSVAERLDIHPPAPATSAQTSTLPLPDPLPSLVSHLPGRDRGRRGWACAGTTGRSTSRASPRSWLRGCRRGCPVPQPSPPCRGRPSGRPPTTAPDPSGPGLSTFP